MMEVNTFGEIIMFDGKFVKDSISNLKKDYDIKSSDGIDYLLFDGRELIYSAASNSKLVDGVFRFNELPGSLKLSAITFLIETYKELCGSLLLSDMKNTINSENIFVSINDNEINGILTYEKNLSSERKFSNMFIKQFLVSKDLKGKGIGRKIMQEFESFSIKEGIENITLTTESSFDFLVYEKLGFELLYSFTGESSENMVFRKGLDDNYTLTNNRLSFLTEDFMNYLLLEDLYYGSSDPLTKLISLNGVKESF